MDKELKWFDSNMERTIVVASNHDDMLDRAMYQGDWRDNLKNAEIFIDMLKITLSGQAPKGIIPYHISKYFSLIAYCSSCEQPQKMHIRSLRIKIVLYFE